MKKIVAFLLTFVMLFTMVACSSASGSNPTTVPKPSGDASGAISEGSDGKEPIIVGFWGGRRARMLYMVWCRSI